MEAGDFLCVHAMAGPQVNQVWEQGPAAAHGAQHRLQDLCTNTYKKSWGNSCFFNFKFALFWYSQKLDLKNGFGFFFFSVCKNSVKRSISLENRDILWLLTLHRATELFYISYGIKMSRSGLLSCTTVSLVSAFILLIFMLFSFNYDF